MKVNRLEPNTWIQPKTFEKAQEEWRSFLPAEVFTQITTYSRPYGGASWYVSWQKEGKLLFQYYSPGNSQVVVDILLELVEGKISCEKGTFDSWSAFQVFLDKERFSGIDYFEQNLSPDQMEIGQAYVVGVRGSCEGRYEYVLRVNSAFIRRISFVMQAHDRILDSRERRYDSFPLFVQKQREDVEFVYPFLSNQILWASAEAAHRAGEKGSFFCLPEKKENRPTVIFYRYLESDFRVRWSIEIQENGALRLANMDATGEGPWEVFSYEDMLAVISSWKENHRDFREVTEREQKRKEEMEKAWAVCLMFQRVDIEEKPCSSDARSWVAGTSFYSWTKEGVRVQYLPYGSEQVLEMHLYLKDEKIVCGDKTFPRWNDFDTFLQGQLTPGVPYVEVDIPPDQMIGGSHYRIYHPQKPNEFYEYVYKREDGFIRRVQFCKREGGNIQDCRGRTYSSLPVFIKAQQEDEEYLFPFLSNEIVFSFEEGKRNAAYALRGLNRPIFSEPKQKGEHPSVLMWQIIDLGWAVKWQIERQGEEIVLLNPDAKEPAYGHFTSYEEALQTIATWANFERRVFDSRKIDDKKAWESFPPTCLVRVEKRRDLTQWDPNCMYLLRVDGHRKAWVQMRNTRFVVISERGKGEYSTFPALVAAFTGG